MQGDAYAPGPHRPVRLSLRRHHPPLRICTTDADVSILHEERAFRAEHVPRRTSAGDESKQVNLGARRHYPSFPIDRFDDEFDRQPKLSLFVRRVLGKFVEQFFPPLGRGVLQYELS